MQTIKTHIGLGRKLKAHLWTSGRWFAIPFFGGSVLIGSLLAGGTLSELNAWLGFLATALLMACGHSQNSYIDWAVGLDKPEGEGSVEKGYTGGCGILKVLSPKELIMNFTGWGIAGLIVCGVIAMRVTPYIFIPAILGLAVPYLYTKGKFSWYHETALASGVVLAGVTGMFAVNPHPAWWQAIIVVLPVATVLSYLGLAFDEYLDAYSNLKKGVKSLAYKVWENRFDLSVYILAWLVIVYAFQVFLIAVGLLKPLTMISLICFPFLLAILVFLKPHADAIRDNPLDKTAQDRFNRVGKLLVLVAMMYPVLILIGQAIEG
jgi:4-hydroxybenzoate polyprenyltransferase